MKVIVAILLVTLFENGGACKVACGDAPTFACGQSASKVCCKLLFLGVRLSVGHKFAQSYMKKF